MGIVTLGVVADTHVPDRAPGIPQQLLSVFKNREVQAILHAGDICIPAVLEELQTIAPVHAVRGNRDIFYLRHLPIQCELAYNGVTVSLIHGHGSLRQYIVDRINYMVSGLDIRHFQQRVLQHFPDSRVIVFGHIHHPLHRWIGGQFIFNPGSACCPTNTRRPPSAGLITLDEFGGIQGEIFDLE